MELYPDILKGQRVQEFHDYVDDNGNHKVMGLQPTKRIQSFEYDPPLDDQVIDRLYEVEFTSQPELFTASLGTTKKMMDEINKHFGRAEWQ